MGPSGGTPRQLLFFLVIGLCCCGHGAWAATSAVDTASLLALKKAVGSPKALSSWKGNDPCGGQWAGVTECNNSRVQSLSLPNLGLTGVIPPDLGNLTALTLLDLSINNFTGSIPSELGQLSLLSTLSLQRNGLGGPIPESLTACTNMTWLILNNNALTGGLPPAVSRWSNMRFFDITSNYIAGRIPVNPGVDNWTTCLHLHLSNNLLTNLPPEIGNLQYVIHFLTDNNTISGGLPQEYTNMSRLQILRFNNNPIGGSIPTNYGNFASLYQLSLSNCSLVGPIPALSGIPNLTSLDLSYNQLAGPFPSAIGTSLGRLQTIDLAGNQLSGPLPSQLSNLTVLQSLSVANNFFSGRVPDFNGSLNFSGLNHPAPLNNLDITNNKFNGTLPLLLLNASVNSSVNASLNLLASGNPLCLSIITQPACQVAASPLLGQWSYDYCGTTTCAAGQYPSYYEHVTRGICVCSAPVLVRIRLLAPPFYNFTDNLMTLLSTDVSKKFQMLDINIAAPQVLGLWVNETDSIAAAQLVELLFFPAGGAPWQPAQTAVIVNALSTQKVQLNATFGPYSVVNLKDPIIIKSSSSLSGGAIAGIVVGAVVGVAILAAIILFLVVRHIKKKHQEEMSHPFNSWGFGGAEVDLEGLNLQGVRYFTLDELSKATNNFNTIIGEGGYGSVYKGTLATGEVAAIKRAKPDSQQGGKEFRNEIELLSKVRHRNLVVLLGFCKERGEQLLVYEFIPNGTLFEQLHGKVKDAPPLTWSQRVSIGLGAARGLAYLHNDINPPIIHRDIKTANILIDERHAAKVADFGLSKSVPEPSDVLEDGAAASAAVETKVKGTLGYLDPEYFLTDRLTEKSDVYSFGVVLLEIVTGRRPIENNEHIIRHVNSEARRSGVVSVMDKVLGPDSVQGAQQLVVLALRCVHDMPTKRPAMQQVVAELEAIRGLPGGGGGGGEGGGAAWGGDGVSGSNASDGQSLWGSSAYLPSGEVTDSQSTWSMNYNRPMAPRQVGDQVIDYSGSYQPSTVLPK